MIHKARVISADEIMRSRSSAYDFMIFNDKEMQEISKHITYKEATNSYTAKRNNISNKPNEKQLNNMVLLAVKVFEPLREWNCTPIKVNSFFRSSKLNTIIGGSFYSQHCKGQAIDIDDVYGGSTNAEMFHYIKDNLDFDQLIWEFGDNNNPDWVHVSYVGEESNRKQVIRARRNKYGKIYYTNYE